MKYTNSDEKIQSIINSDIMHFIYEQLTDREKEVAINLMKNQLFYYNSLNHKNKNDFLKLFSFKDENTMLNSVIFIIYNKRKDIDIYNTSTVAFGVPYATSYNSDLIDFSYTTNKLNIENKSDTVICTKNKFELIDTIAIENENENSLRKMLILEIPFVFYNSTQKGFQGGVYTIKLPKNNATENKINEREFLKKSLDNIRKVKNDCRKVSKNIEDCFGTDTQCFCEIGIEEIVENLENYILMKYGESTMGDFDWYIWECELGDIDNGIVNDAKNGKSNFTIGTKDYYIIDDNSFLDMIFDLNK